MSNPQSPKQKPERVLREAAALRENLAKRKQQERLRQTPQDKKEED